MSSLVSWIRHKCVTCNKMFYCANRFCKISVDYLKDRFKDVLRRDNNGIYFYNCHCPSCSVRNRRIIPIGICIKTYTIKELIIEIL